MSKEGGSLAAGGKGSTAAGGVGVVLKQTTITPHKVQRPRKIAWCFHVLTNIQIKYKIKVCIVSYVK